MSGAVDNRRIERLFDKYVSPTKVNCYKENRYYFAWIEVTNRCPGSCAYCYVTTIDKPEEVSIPEEKLKEIIDDIKALKIHHIYWGGGDPLIYPQLFPLLEYARAQGMSNGVFTSGLPLTKEVCRNLVKASQNRLINVLGIHIDTLHEGVGQQVFLHPKDLINRIDGYKRLLDAGFPPERVFNCVTLTRPSAETFEETFDWSIDDMGARFMEIMVFVPETRGARNTHFEPSLSQVRRAYEYRAKRMSDPTWARIGSTECSIVHCRTYFCVTAEGNVVPCFPLQHIVVGNIYQERLRDIAVKSLDSLTLRDIPVKGRCASCENNDVCTGCRANAYHYAGDISAPDPKCWLNPEAQETYL